ncbi:MAG: hypothetical protein A2X36_13020 [Elusimicrobia bacterium GWA2_69_24]|nr:MAG: hypothetical protein A2X36_13020 [Elusimicrobia bacterium GWA2_69_24]HBL15456.1 hypothetical protein [Elusimicrobiota bacterium]
MRLLGSLLLLSLLPPPAGAAAQPEPEGALWSTGTYVRAVLEASPEVQQAREDSSAAAAVRRSQFARAYFPSLAFAAVLRPAQLAGGPRFTFGSWRAGADDLTLTPGLNWNFFNSFKDELSLRSKSLKQRAADLEFETRLQNTALGAVRTYYGLFLRDKLLAVSAQNLSVQKAQYELTLDRYQHGMKSLSDLLKTETDWQSTRLSAETAQAQRRLALFRFNVAVTRAEDSPAAFPDPAGAVPPAVPDLEAGLRSALLDRPEMRKDRLSLELADADYRLAKISAGPGLSLDFDLSQRYDAAYGRPPTSYGLRNTDYNFTLKLALPSAFNLYSQTQDVAAAGAQWRKSRQGSEALRRALREEVYQAHIELMRAIRSHEIALRKEDISRQNLEIVQEQYSQGSADVIRLSQAQADYFNAQQERVQSFHDANVNWARWQVAIGVPIWR